MRKAKIALGTLGASLATLAIMLFIDSLPPSTSSNILVERSKASQSGNINSVRLRSIIEWDKDNLTNCAQHIIPRSVQRYSEGSIDILEGELGLYTDCYLKWEGGAYIGDVDYDRQARRALEGTAWISATWGDGKYRRLPIYFDPSRLNEGERVAAQPQKFEVKVPQGVVPVLKAEIITSKSVEKQRPALLRNSSYGLKIIEQDGIPLQPVTEDELAAWYIQRIEEFDIRKLNPRNPYIESIQVIPTKRGLEIRAAMNNLSTETDIVFNNRDHYPAGFYLDLVLDSTGRIVRRYGDSILFSLKFDSNIPPQLSDDGSGTVRHLHTFPKNAKYLVGGLSLGYVPNPWNNFYFKPVVIDVNDMYSQPPSEGRLGFLRPIRNFLYGVKDLIWEKTHPLSF